MMEDQQECQRVFLTYAKPIWKQIASIPILPIYITANHLAW